MNRLLLPALWLMNRLKYLQKFFLVGLLLLIPLALVMSQYVVQINKDIDFAASERLGLKYVAPLARFLQAIEEHDALAGAIISGEESLKPALLDNEAQIDKAIQAVDIADNDHGKTLSVSAHWSALKDKWQVVKNKANSAADNHEAHAAYITEVRSLITEVGNNSLLILDPDIDTYYLMDNVINKLPLLTDYLSQTRAATVSGIVEQTVDSSTAQQGIYARLITVTLDSSRQSYQYVFDYNPAMKERLESIVSAEQDLATEYLSLFNQRSVAFRRANAFAIATMKPMDYMATANKITNTVFGVYDSTIPALDSLLLVRLDNLLARRNLVLVVALFNLAIAIYLLNAFYVSVRHTIAQLDEASKGMVSGTLQEIPALETRDELAQVTASFNNVARALVSTSASLEAILDSAADGIVTLDDTGTVRSFNDAAEQIFGVPSDQVIGQQADQLIPALDAGNNGTAFAEGQRETEGRRHDGTTFPADISISKVQLENSVLFTLIIRDITARKLAENELRSANDELSERTSELEVANALAKEANRLKSEFLSTMSHELRTPLNAIVGFTDLLLTEKPGALNDNQRTFLKSVAGNNRRLLGLINDILDLSRIEAGRMEIHLAPYSPQEMLDRIVTQTASLFSQKSLAFKTNFDASLPRAVEGDRARVEQIVVNLLSNASKFTEHGEVELYAGSDSQSAWQISVRDTGPGIAPHMQEIIFEPFRQVDGTSSRAHGGSGLGLAIARELCRMMDGTLQVQSELGRGSTFVITLPLGETTKISQPPHLQIVA